MTVVLETVLGFVARPCFYAVTLVASFFFSSFLSSLTLQPLSPLLVLPVPGPWQKRDHPARNLLDIYCVSVL